MAEKIVLKLNKNQLDGIKKAFGGVCDTIEIDKDQLTHVLLYMPAPVLMDFDDNQQQLLNRAVPNKKCNYIVIDGNQLCNVLRYMPPRGGVVKYMPPPKGVVKYMPPPIVVKYMAPLAKKK